MVSASATIPVGYKQTEVGVIPEDWDVKSLGLIGEISGAGVDKKIVEGETPVRLVNYLDVYNRSFIYSDELDHYVTAPPSKAIKCSVRKGDVFFTPTSEVRDDIAVSAIAMENIPDGAYSYHVVRLRIRDDWDLNYRAYAFQTKAFLDQAAVLSDGSGTRYVISLPNFRKLKVLVPSKLEQQAIGQVLTHLDSQIQALENLIGKKRDIKQGTMQELLTGKTRLPGFTIDFGMNKLKHFVTNFIVPMRDKPKKFSGNIPWCRIEDFDGKYLSYSKSGRFVNEDTISQMNLKVYPVNTVLVSCSANLGQCAIVKRELVSNQTFIGLVVDKSKASSEYLFYYMKYIEKELNNQSSGTTISYLSREEFEELDVFMPSSKDEQTAIAEVLSDMDAEIDSLEQRLEKTKAIKQGMMQQLLTGRIRLVDPSTPVEASA